MLSSDYKAAVSEEGQALDNPVLGLISFEGLPLFGREEAIPIRNLQVLTKQPANLRLCPNSKIADLDTVLAVFDFHYNYHYDA